MIPAFSVAISSIVSPRYFWWSSPIGVSTTTSPRTTLVQSQTPPIPTSTAAASTGASANAANAIGVSTSNAVNRCGNRASTTARYGATSW
jgi:hypothetical protein